MASYSMFGLNINTNLVLPGLTDTTTEDSESEADVHIWLQDRPQWLTHLLEQECQQPVWYTSPYHDENGEIHLQVFKIGAERYFWFKYSDLSEYVISADGSQIWINWLENTTLERVTAYIVGTTLGFVLRLRGINCLHGSAVEIDGKAVVFMGRPGAGKSTTVAAFSKLMHCSILSDNTIPLIDQGASFMAQPAHPRVNLWPKSIEALYDFAESQPRVIPEFAAMDKRYVNLEEKGYKFGQQPLPLAAIYQLDWREPLDTPLIEALSAQTALLYLIENTYPREPIDKYSRAREFELMGRLSKTVPIRKITPSDDISRLGQLCETIMTDFRGIR